MLDAINAIKKSIGQWKVWTYFGWLDIKLKYRTSIIGPFWITASLAVFCLALTNVYSAIFHIEMSGMLLYIAAGLSSWTLIIGPISESPTILISNSGYIKEAGFNPVEVILRCTFRNIIIYIHNLIFVLIIIFFGYGILNYVIFLLPLNIFLVLINVSLLSLIISIIGARYRDIGPIVQNITQLLFLITPVFWKINEQALQSPLVYLNPFYYYLDLLRSPMLGIIPSKENYIVTIASSFILLFIFSYLHSKYKKEINFWI
jgi:ABC-type polysaccharide/polyol phosphate export permease